MKASSINLSKTKEKSSNFDFNNKTAFHGKVLIIGLEIITMEECSVCLELDTNKDKKNVPANQIDNSISNDKLSNPWPKLEKFYFLKFIRNRTCSLNVFCADQKSLAYQHAQHRIRIFESIGR